jgi:hypothetical protein
MLLINLKIHIIHYMIMCITNSGVFYISFTTILYIYSKIDEGLPLNYRPPWHHCAIQPVYGLNHATRLAEHNPDIPAVNGRHFTGFRLLIRVLRRYSGPPEDTRGIRPGSENTIPSAPGISDFLHSTKYDFFTHKVTFLGYQVTGDESRALLGDVAREQPFLHARTSGN